MIAWDISTLIGATYIIFAVVGIAIDSLIIVAIFKSGLLGKKTNPIYILATYAIFDVILRLVCTASYWGTTVLFQSPIFDDELYGRFNFHCTQVMFAIWAEGSITQVLIAFDRFFTMKAVMIDRNMNPKSKVFTRRNCTIYVCAVFPTLLAVQYINSLVIWPCCDAYYVYTMYSIVYKNPRGQFNSMFNVVIRPFAALCSVLPITCYVAIFAMSYQAQRQKTSLDAALAAKRKREVYRSLQFSFVFVFYVALWITFELHPLLPRDPPVFFSLEIYVAICDCITTGLIQGVMNHRIRRTLIGMLNGWFGLHLSGGPNQVGATGGTLVDNTLPASSTAASGKEGNKKKANKRLTG